MKGRIITDWSKVNFRDPVSRLKVVGALQHFLRLPDEKGSPVRTALQHLAIKGDFPAEILQILEKYHAVPFYDLGYEQIFDIKDFTGTTESGFEILDVEDGLTFNKVQPGDKAKVYGMKGSKVSVTFDMYGGGLQWLRTLIDDRKYWTLEDNAIAFRNKAYYSRASNFYALIEAVSSAENVDWQAVDGAIPNTDPAYIPIRDANTINLACGTILSDLKDKGMGVTPQSQFILLSDVTYKSRTERALAYLQQAFSGSQKLVQFSITPQYTLMLQTPSVYYVILPKGKLKGGNRMDLTVFDQFDIMSYADVMVGWMRYGGAIGEVNQVKRCLRS
jgi:hypothetical protein